MLQLLSYHTLHLENSSCCHAWTIDYYCCKVKENQPTAVRKQQETENFHSFRVLNKTDKIHSKIYHYFGSLACCCSVTILLLCDSAVNYLLPICCLCRCFKTKCFKEGENNWNKLCVMVLVLESWLRKLFEKTRNT